MRARSVDELLRVNEDQDDNAKRDCGESEGGRPGPGRSANSASGTGTTNAGTGRTAPCPSASHPRRPSPGARVSSRSRPRQGRPDGRPLRGKPLTRALALKEQRRSRDARSLGSRRKHRHHSHAVGPRPTDLVVQPEDANGGGRTSSAHRRHPPSTLPGGRTHGLRALSHPPHAGTTRGHSGKLKARTAHPSSGPAGTNPGSSPTWLPGRRSRRQDAAP